MPNFYGEGDSECPPEKAISKDEVCDTCCIRKNIVLLCFTSIDEYIGYYNNEAVILFLLFEKENNVLPKLSARVGAKKFSEDSLLCIGIEKQGSLFSWSSASKEAEALMHLNEHASCNSRPKKSSKCARLSLVISYHVLCFAEIFIIFHW